MRLLLILMVVATILQAFRISIYYLRKDISSIKKIIEIVVLILMVILSYFNLTGNILKLTFCISTILSMYIFISFIYEKLFKNEYISILSVKKGIDMSDTGVMFLDDNNNIVLMNNLMSDILKELNIKEDYINNLIKKCIENINNDYLLKCNNRVYLLKILNDKELSLIDITELYKLQEQEKLQNKKIRENNEKI